MEAVKRAHSSSDAWASRLAIESSADGGFTMRLGGDHMNFLDVAHGGALYSLCEKALRATASVGGRDVTVVDTHLVLTAGGREGDTFTATVEPVSIGRTLGVYSVPVTRGGGRLGGRMTGAVWVEARRAG